VKPTAHSNARGLLGDLCWTICRTNVKRNPQSHFAGEYTFVRKALGVGVLPV